MTEKEFDREKTEERIEKTKQKIKLLVDNEEVFRAHEKLFELNSLKERQYLIDVASEAGLFTKQKQVVEE